MEKNSLRISTSERNIKEINTKVRSSPSDPWVHYNSIVKDGDLLAAGFSWPPRSYTCSFCRRDFRSAQALGGHMNVHRRDRARLRQSPPPRDHAQHYYSPLHLNLNLDPNPNPNPSYNNSPSRRFHSSNPNMLPFVPQSFHSSTLSSTPSGTAKESEAVETVPVKPPWLVHHKKGIVRLELEIGLKEELDLELRLGCNV